MKHLTTLILLISLSTILYSQVQTSKLWTEEDRQFLLEGLAQTRADLLNEVKGLNEVQIAFKPDSNKWSIAEVLEHLGTFEELLHWDVFCNQYTPEQKGFTENVTGKDSIMLAYATDTTKGNSPPIAVPLGRFTTLDELVKYFEYHRNAVISLVKNTTADFRKHYIYRPSEWGDWAIRDLHQYIVVYITHTTRHTNQIKRIKAEPNYPIQGKFWTEQDRKSLLKELSRTKQSIIDETTKLSVDQWHFKPSADAWSIAQVVEHLGLYERIFLQEAWIALELPPQPQFYKASLSDSIYLSWMAESQAHQSAENAMPMGFMKGKDNLTYFTFGRDNIIDFVNKTSKDLKVHFTPREGEPNNRRSIHGLLVVHYGHTDRHLRQILRIKSNPDFPR